MPVRGGSQLEWELGLRLEAMRWLDAREGELVRQHELAEFAFEGGRIPLMDRQRGIRKPAGMSSALSFRTTYTRPGAVPPYADTAGPDGLLRYKYRGDDRQHPENVALRNAQRQSAPLIWFVGVAVGLYLPRYPVWLIGDEPERVQFVVALDEGQRRLDVSADVTVDEAQRRYAERVTRQRLHQPLFRARVLEAYERRCAMCRLRHAPLLDASHIIGDAHALGQPVVPNGLALCKIHHAAFDQNMLGVHPDLRVQVSKSVLAETDGPMLLHGIQALHDKQLTVPRSRASRPSEDRLQLRFEEFLATA